jgi:pimeloyl-ACP methyl ester carboxylesterase
VYAPPNPLRGLASDAESVAAFLKALAKPVILVGHSYGGSVISVASAAQPNVKALVFIDAFVPDAGESCLSILAAGPPPPNDLFTPVPLASGDADLYFTPKYYGAVFATGVPEAISSLMAVTQRPITGSALNEKAPTGLAWKTLPSWYVVGDLDQAIPPAIQTKMAERAKSHVTHVSAGHPSMIQHPEATLTAIAAAIQATASAMSKN